MTERVRVRGKIDLCCLMVHVQEVSLLDVRKEINFCKRIGIRVIGVVENMSGFVCPKCQVRTQCEMWCLLLVKLQPCAASDLCQTVFNTLALCGLRRLYVFYFLVMVQCHIWFLNFEV